MPRKSRELRLSQTKSLIEAYSNAGIGHADRSFRFMNDMAARLERGKGMSAGQRNYLDSLIEQGVPKQKNEERVKEILAAAEVDGMQEVSSTLRDFAYKVGKGWALSEKQEAFLQKLIQKSVTLKAEGRFRPSDESIKDLKMAVSILGHKNHWYWNHRVGTAKAYDKVHVWLKWLDGKNAADKIAESHPDTDFKVGEEPIIDQWSCNKILKTVKNQIHEIKNPKHTEGSMVWKDMHNAPRVCALVAGPPIVQKGEIVYPCLVDGQDVMVPRENLRKRRG